MISTFIIGSASLHRVSVGGLDAADDTRWRMQINGHTVEGQWSDDQLEELLLVLKVWKESREK